MRIQKILGLAAVLVLIGAGCDSPTQKADDSEDKPAIEQQEGNEDSVGETAEGEGNEEDMTTDDSEETEDSSSEEDKKSDEGEDRDDEGEDDDDFSIDDTWRTYTSRSSDWQFNWPTKGLYAPMWEVTFEGDDELDGGCVKGDSDKLTIAGVEFCHTHKLSEGTSYDYFVTKLGGTNIVLNFTKDTEQYRGFNMEDYQKSLRQVVSTFKALK